MSTTRISAKSLLVTGALAASMVAGLVGPTPFADAARGSANKVSASASTVTEGGANETIELLSTSVKLSTPTDLVMSVSLECSILTSLVNSGDSEVRASGTLEVWVEIDGKVAPVVASDTGNVGDEALAAGSVTFCERAYGRTTSFPTLEDDYSIESFINTKAAHSFNWLALDELWAGGDDNVYEIKVFGKLVQTGEVIMDDGGASDATAEVYVGKRTLIVEPTRVATNGGTVDLG